LAMDPFGIDKLARNFLAAIQLAAVVAYWMN
jgi:hypothetical protein